MDKSVIIEQIHKMLEKANDRQLYLIWRLLRRML